MSEVRNLPELLEALKRGYTVSNGKVIPPPKRMARVRPAAREPKRAFCISVAGQVIAIDAQYGTICGLCEKYLCSLSPGMRIAVDARELAREADETREVDAPRDEGSLEVLAIHRRISEEMLSFDTFLMHGAVVAVEGGAYMFSAPSGTGKTTHVQKWLERAPGAYIVNGDKPLIHITEDGALACGTPWCGKERLGENAMVPLRAIALMERAEDNRIREISFGEAFVPLLQQTYRPQDPEKMKKTLELLSRLEGRVRFYRFECNNMKADVFETAFGALAGRGQTIG